MSTTVEVNRRAYEYEDLTEKAKQSRAFAYLVGTKQSKEDYLAGKQYLFELLRQAKQNAGGVE